MQFTTALLAAISITTVIADFQIYSNSDLMGGDPIVGVQGGFNIGYVFVNSGKSLVLATTSIFTLSYATLINHAEPSCDDINHAGGTAGASDASYSGVRCADCIDPEPNNWDIKELEWNTDMGHFTIYRMICNTLLENLKAHANQHYQRTLATKSRRRTVRPCEDTVYVTPVMTSSAALGWAIIILGNACLFVIQT